MSMCFRRHAAPGIGLVAAAGLAFIASGCGSGSTAATPLAGASSAPLTQSYLVTLQSGSSVTIPLAAWGSLGGLIGSVASGTTLRADEQSNTPDANGNYSTVVTLTPSAAASGQALANLTPQVASGAIVCGSVLSWPSSASVTNPGRFCFDAKGPLDVNYRALIKLVSGTTFQGGGSYQLQFDVYPKAIAQLAPASRRRGNLKGASVVRRIGAP